MHVYPGEQGSNKQFSGEKQRLAWHVALGKHAQTPNRASNAQPIPGSHVPLQDGFVWGFPPQGCGVVVVLEVVVVVVVLVGGQTSVTMPPPSVATAGFTQLFSTRSSGDPPSGHVPALVIAVENFPWALGMQLTVSTAAPLAAAFE